jgi:hypothetical protein
VNQSAAVNADVPATSCCSSVGHEATTAGSPPAAVAGAAPLGSAAAISRTAAVPVTAAARAKCRNSMRRVGYPR